MKLYIGDLVFPEPSGFVGKGIAAVTRSKFSHVGMVYNQEWIFEAHVWINTRLNPMSEYKGKTFRVLRPGLSKIEKHHVKKLMEEFNGNHYSVWDIATNFTFSWLKPITRRKLVNKLGSKKMMICSELVGRILYNVDSDKYKPFEVYSGLQPNDVFVLGLDCGMKEILEAVKEPVKKIEVIQET